MNKTPRGNKGQIYNIIRKKGEVTIDELKDSTEFNYNTIRGALVALTNEDMIERVKRGVYRVLKT